MERASLHKSRVRPTNTLKTKGEIQQHAIKKGSHFEIEDTSFPTIVGIATTAPDPEGFFQAKIYSGLYPLGTSMRVIKFAPSRLVSVEEFNQFKAELEQRAIGGQGSCSESPTMSRKKS